MANPCGAGRPSHASPARRRVFDWAIRGRDLCCAAFCKTVAGTTMTSINDRMSSIQSGSTAGTWRTPALIIGFGCLISLMSFGPRSSLGFFLTPVSNANHWGRDGTARVICAGGLMYACGLVLMGHATSAPLLDVSAGALIGFGLSGTSFMVLLAAFGKLLPPGWRSLAFGFGTAAGSFGQFLYSPLAVALMDRFGWQQTLTIFGVSM